MKKVKKCILISAVLLILLAIGIAPFHARQYGLISQQTATILLIPCGVLMIIIVLLMAHALYVSSVNGKGNKNE